ncbi:peptidyl-alpha-hydroxyglycine alpha-amidating lyase 2 [Anopheles cruzii]|uniref:peptidyl-alpha-hydroxyglycine alpha-amidating lyase 2 n=1 Tax=Anopheles cruzii TaxID=68878 RepID=UPI0022EC3291|nr:peptidyl-alpha-hydroxyglycine alpha-amidating lyase 2 [Anopheles cruzii]XP_052861494.1 peptidyl-alpha-hydroxyglycine alpha-amidating lyase 2 [Anopheles cruzii]
MAGRGTPKVLRMRPALCAMPPLLLLLLLMVVVALAGVDSYTVPRDTDILLADGFFKRMRDLFAERAYEDTLSSGGAAGGQEMADEAGPPVPVDMSHLDSPPKPKLVEDWPKVKHTFGQVTAVAIDLQGNPVIFHRASRTWTAESFNESNHYQQIAAGPIPESTIATLSAADGAVVDERAAGIFYMPHGLTIDRSGNMWLTDVALHQVFKFMPGRDYPSITLGRRFEPGSSKSHLCKPTAVAIASTGEIFVADGYCNSRLLKYNAAGRLIRTIPQPPEFLSLQTPHGLALLEHLDMVCVADRENMRVVCPRAGLQSSYGEGTQAATIQEPDLGRVFDVAAYGDLVYAVNGPTSPMIPVRGFTIDPRSETIIDHWGKFENPHSITFCPNGSAMYVTEIGPNRVWKFTLTM